MLIAWSAWWQLWQLRPLVPMSVRKNALLVSKRPAVLKVAMAPDGSRNGCMFRIGGPLTSSVSWADALTARPSATVTAMASFLIELSPCSETRDLGIRGIGIAVPKVTHVARNRIGAVLCSLYCAEYLTTQ